ncbi:hypothetical protein LL253_10335, partial [Sphingobium soli]|nr:hypothetical protein [Sphingobium soli]
GRVQHGSILSGNLRPTRVTSQWKSTPCFNAEAARWIFLDALKMSGSYWKAMGIYHSPNGARQRRYAALVAIHLQKRFGSDVFGSRRDVQARSVP